MISFLTRNSVLIGLLLFSLLLISGCATAPAEPEQSKLQICKFFPSHPDPKYPGILIVYLRCEDAEQVQLKPKPKGEET